MPRAKTTASAGSAKRAAPARSPVEMLIVVEGIGGDGRTELTVTGGGIPIAAASQANSARIGLALVVDQPADHVSQLLTFDDRRFNRLQEPRQP